MKDTFHTRSYKGGHIHTCNNRDTGKTEVSVTCPDGMVRRPDSIEEAEKLLDRWGRKPRFYSLSHETGKTPASIRRIVNLAKKHGVQGETYGTYCHLGSEISGVAYLQRQKSNRHVNMDFTRHRNGTTQTRITFYG